MDEERRPTPGRDALTTFGAIAAALVLASAAASPFPASRHWIGSGLYVVLVVAYGVLTRPGRDTSLNHYVGGAFLVPFLYVAFLLALLPAMPEPLEVGVVDLTSRGLNAGLFLEGGADAPLDILIVAWWLSMVPLTLLAVGAQQWIVMRRDDWA
jgi:hypothetical protein